jgi:hypothetical protein
LLFLLPQEGRKTFSVSYPNDLPERLVELFLVQKLCSIHQVNRAINLYFNLRVCHLLEKLSIVQSEAEIGQLLHKVIFERVPLFIFDLFLIIII